MVKISELVAKVAAITGSEEIEINDSGTSNKLPLSAILNRARHTGTQLAATISDFAAAARAAARPVQQLFYAPSTDIANPVSLTTAGAVYTIVPAQNFAVTSASARLYFEVALSIQVGTTSGLQRYVAEAMIDGAFAAKLDSLILPANGYGYLRGRAFSRDGLAAGTHTIAVRVACDVAGSAAYLRAASQPAYEYVEIRVLEVAP